MLNENPWHKECIDAVLDHAEENYNKGWDIFIEAWTRHEIEQELYDNKFYPPPLSVDGAIHRLQQIVTFYDDMKNDRCVNEYIL